MVSSPGWLMIGLYPGHHAMQGEIASRGCGTMPQAPACDMSNRSLCLADRAITTGHHIHMAMRALPVTMHPDKLFGSAAGGATRHDMRRLDRLLLLVSLVPVRCQCTHPGPSLSFSLCRAAALPSWNVPNQTSSGKSTLPKLHSKISVVKLMMKVPNHHAAAVAKQHFMKPGMAEDRRQRQHVAMKHHQHRMRRHYKMNQ